MAKTNFFPAALTPSIGSIVDWTGAQPNDGADLTLIIRGVAPIERAGPGDLTFLDNPRYVADLSKTRASAVLLQPRHSPRAPAGCVALATGQPYRAFTEVLLRLFPGAARPGSTFGETSISARASVHPSARLEAGVIVDPGAVVGPRAQIGANTLIGANAVIGPDVHIGRDSAVGASCTVLCALIGDRVILHPGVRIGQDGFGFAMGPRGHLKVPQVGRVILQDDVEIGAGTAIDRGANRDTVIGEGTKIDNLVQIGHNVVIGRHCVIVSQAGISGSCTIEDFVAIGGQAGLAGHLHIGAGAQIAADAGLMHDVPAGARWGGSPAQPIRDWFKEAALLRKMVRRSGAHEPPAEG
ncbi:UDP-3-O-(3-hydroxymyristoyl)glucosamine N-acyltransferase [Methylocapsa sp. S129]|uniref:UDP-3-O-(3-hydroxymyristoyl)glucosamine N-acyltransferase n=1 Tax=Methylocapsa sp. S129 TaxID=1641869 RepID=UPI00131EAE74|nr:UDP-3-O-(3-hydroxymyristoyl)glucosamine N-acyltransferase [Methylocapsa sp. S129]